MLKSLTFKLCQGKLAIYHTIGQEESPFFISSEVFNFFSLYSKFVFNVSCLTLKMDLSQEHEWFCYLQPLVCKNTTFMFVKILCMKIP